MTKTNNTDTLPPELLEALENSKEAQMKHRWAFSFMPVEKEHPSIGFKTAIFLVGYCSVCNTSFSSIVHIDRLGAPSTNYAGVPKWGCVPEQEL